MSDAWAAHVEAFVDGHCRSTRGRVRTHVVDQHLRWHLPPPPGPIVDVGGGAGTQSLPLARRGYDVTIVDPSAAMLRRARAARDDQTDDVARRVTLLHADGVEAVGHLGTGRFAGVLCHGVVPYVDARAPLIAALSTLARPGGIVSILAKNAAALAMRPALEGRWADALSAFDADGEVNGLGLYTRADTVDGLAAELAHHDVERVAWYGVRLFVEAPGHDRRAAGDAADADADTEVDADTFAAEVEASRRDPYRRLSRLLHVIGRRREPRVREAPHER